MKWLNNIQSYIEGMLPKDKLEHFFIMSLFVLPVSLVWHCWWLTLPAAAFGATAKELIDVQYRGKQWAIAPLLTEKVSNERLREPLYGTLIFHPSPLPYGRGARAIRMAYQRREPITAATWFWANHKFDAADICEQEIIKIDYDLSPREFYEQHVIPAMARTLNRALNDLDRGIKRQITQVEKYSTYD